MRKYMVYESKDGRTFRNERACLDWEYYRDHLPPSIRWFDEDGRPVEPNSYREVDTMYNDMMIMEVLDTPSYSNDLKYLYTEFGFGDMNMTPGRYVYIYNVYNKLSAEWCNNHEILGWNEWALLHEDDDIEKILKGEV